MSESPSELRRNISEKKRELLQRHCLPKKRSHLASQYNRVLSQIGDRVAEFSINNMDTEEEFEERFYDSIQILKSVKSALSQANSEVAEIEELPEEEITEDHHVIWFHGDVQQAFQEGYESKHAKKVDRASLTDMAVEYLHRPWMENELLEWIMVDSLLFSEITAFGESLKQYSPNELFDPNLTYFAAGGNFEKMKKMATKKNLEKFWIKFVSFLIVLLFIAGFSFFAFSRTWAIAGTMLYLGVCIFIVIARGAFRYITKEETQEQEMKKNKMAQIYMAMIEVYYVLRDGTISPRYLRDRVYEAAKKGAVWPSAVFMLVDHAVQRNPAIWNAPQSAAYQAY